MMIGQQLQLNEEVIVETDADGNQVITITVPAEGGTFELGSLESSVSKGGGRLFPLLL